MGLVCVASAKGSPGVTTTALLLGALWRRPSLVLEADPSGGDVAFRMPAADGGTLDPQKGLLSLVAAGRRSLYPALVDQHKQTLPGGLDVLVGVTSSEQAGGLGHWEGLGDFFANMPGTDVIADLGRIGASTPQNALLRHAGAIVLCVDTTPSNVVHLRERLQRLHEQAGQSPPAMYVVVVAPTKRSRAVREVREAIERTEIPHEGVHHLAHDPAGAGFFLGQIRGNPSKTQLVRTGDPLAEQVSARTLPFFDEPGAAESQETPAEGADA